MTKRILITGFTITVLWVFFSCTPQQTCEKEQGPTKSEPTVKKQDAGHVQNEELPEEMVLQEESLQREYSREKEPKDDGTQNQAQIPKIFFDHAFGIDGFCLQSAKSYASLLPSTGLLTAQLVNTWVANNTKWTNEALLSTARLQKAWNSAGPILLKKAVQIVGIPFTRKELTVSTFLCLNRNSMGTPLSMNLAYYNKGPSDALMNNKALKQRLVTQRVSLPMSEAAFVELLFHELLHIYTLQILHHRTTPLIRCKHRKESFTVKGHLHLFALQTKVYQELSKEYPNQSIFSMKVLDRSKRYFRAFQSKGYTRGWEIIEKEGIEPFLKELRGKRQTPLCKWCTETDWFSIEWLLKLVQKPSASCP